MQGFLEHVPYINVTLLYVDVLIGQDSQWKTQFFIHSESLLLLELECWLAVAVCKFQIVPYVSDVSSLFVVISGN